VFGFRRLGDPPSDHPDIVALGEVTVETASASRATKAGWAMRALLRNLPLACAKWKAVRTPDLWQAIDGIGFFEGVIVNGAGLAGAYPRLLSERRAIFIAHNVEYLSAAQNAAHATGLMARVYAREARLMERVERRAIKDSVFSYFLSAEDRDPLRRNTMSG
jgi:hypothetical protein